MCLDARLHALGGMQELVVSPHCGRDGTGVTLRARPALDKEGIVWPELQQSTGFVQSGAENVTRTKAATSTPSSVLKQDGSWP